MIQHMSQVLQIARAYDQDKRMLQKQLVRRHGMSFMPNIYVADDGRNWIRCSRLSTSSIPSGSALAV